MPVVLRVGGFVFSCFPRDHDPPHVHVRYAGRRCKIEIETLKLTKSSMNRSEEARALRLVAARAEDLLAHWITVHQTKTD